MRPPLPLFFPSEEQVAESPWHAEAKVLLADSIKLEFRGDSVVSCDQFLYWDPTNPKRRLAPDVAVRRGTSGEPSPSWKTWKLGAPDVGVELVSNSDQSELRFEEKLQRYRRAGVREVVRFDRDDRVRPIRIWDLVNGDLRIRDPSQQNALFCEALQLYWCVQSNYPELGRVLRLARDSAGRALLPTPLEAMSASREAERAQKEFERAQKEFERAQKEFERAQKEIERRAKEAALKRIEELEAELARRR